MFKAALQARGSSHSDVASVRIHLQPPLASCAAAPAYGSGPTPCIRKQPRSELLPRG